MPKETIISKKELDLLKSNGTVHICKSCRDFKNKIVLLEYKPNKVQAVLEGFCTECKDAVESCGTCNFKK